MKPIIFLLAIIICFPIALKAQEEDDEEIEYRYQEPKFNKLFVIVGSNYGISLYDINPHTSSFNNNFSVDLKLSLINQHVERKSSYALLLRYYLSKGEKSLGGSNDNSKISLSTTKFGANLDISTGYYSENFSIYPYFSVPTFLLTYSYLKINNLPVFIPDNEKEYIQSFEEKIRFGTHREIGFLFLINNKYSIEIGFQNYIIYPRYYFLKDFGSHMLETFAAVIISFPTLALETLLPNPLRSSIANLLSQGTLTYLFSKQRKDKMYWPFNSKPGLSFDEFKLGFGIAF